MTLVELMVSMTIGLMITLAATSVYVNSVKGNSANLKQAMLNQEMRSLIHLMERDIRRAGFWSAVPKSDDLSANPFMSGEDDLSVSEKTGESAGSCVTYSYDLDKDMSIGVGPAATAAPFDAAPYDQDNMEQFGFRASNNKVQMRTGLATPAEDIFSCDTGAWLNVTDKNILVSKLEFTPSTKYLNVEDNLICGTGINCCVSGKACQLIRDISITVTAQLADDASVVKTVTAKTRIRNDKYFIAP